MKAMIYEALEFTKCFQMSSLPFVRALWCWFHFHSHFTDVKLLAQETEYLPKVK